MKTKPNGWYRGSTPKQIFRTPMDFRKAVLFVTYSQGGENVLERSNESMTITADSIEYTLTQEETLKFCAGDVEIQLRYRLPDGTADASKIIHTTAQRVLKGEVI